MAKIAVRTPDGVESTMSLGRARDAVAAGRVQYVTAPKAKKPAKKVAKKTARKAPAKKTTRTMRGRTVTK
jgi:hypothetical protein